MKQTHSKARIIGIGSYLPEKVLSNEDLEKMVDTSDEWIVTRTGMKERRIARNDEAVSDMAYEASLKAIKNAGINKDEIDAIIFATLTPDHLFPATACILQQRLGLNSCLAFDLQAACSGFLYSLSVAKAFIETSQAKRVLVVASEKVSSVVDYEDRATCVLFGDGASACIVSNEGDGFLIRDLTLGADGSQANLLILPAGGSRRPPTKETVENREHFLHMEGKEVFKHAVRRMESAAKHSLQKAGISEDQISYLVPHQANIRIIEAMAKRFSIPEDQVYVTVDRYGNTSASAIAIALDELIQEKEIHVGDNLLLVAFGAGLTWGAGILTKIENEEIKSDE